MFKIISFFVCLFLLFSCSSSTNTKDELIGNCQYIMFKNAYGNIGTHKGDCTNPIHKCNTVVIHDTIYVAVK